MVLVSCNPLKTAKQDLNKGDYDATISITLQKLSKQKSESKQRAYANLLELTFKKAVDRDKRLLEGLQLE